MILYLFIALAVLAVGYRCMPAVIFALCMGVHDYLFSAVPADDYWQYHLSAAILSCVALGSIVSLRQYSRTSTAFAWLSLTAFFLSFYGWTLWLSFLSPVSYDISFLALYSVAIYVILRGDAARDEKRNSFSVFPAVGNKSFMGYRLLFKKAKS